MASSNGGMQGVPGKFATTGSETLVEYIKSTGSVATSEQAMPLFRDSQLAACEVRAYMLLTYTSLKQMARTFG